MHTFIHMYILVHLKLIQCCGKVHFCNVVWKVKRLHILTCKQLKFHNVKSVLSCLHFFKIVGPTGPTFDI